MTKESSPIRNLKAQLSIAQSNVALIKRAAEKGIEINDEKHRERISNCYHALNEAWTILESMDPEAAEHAA
jgi:hypothetical protein